MPTPTTPFHLAGSVADKINVDISLQIIGLFSEGLYSNPNKAVEELVSNSFDADASNVHVVLSPDRRAPDSSIVVIDNGIGMDGDGLKVHWIVGDSRKARNRATTAGRRTIGKFGIGKLAAYVLGNRLTHISRVGTQYFSTSMDFSSIQRTVNADDATAVPTPSAIKLDLRQLTEPEAKAALGSWLTTKAGRKDLKLFGPSASKHWTAAIISDLKPMAADLSSGMLRWVLSTAMPMRDDFVLYLNDVRVAASKDTAKRVGNWTLGRQIKFAKIEPEVEAALPSTDYRHWRLIDPLLGPLTGYIEVFQSPIDTGKSEQQGRSNGFFVYVHGRLINAEDSGFGIDRNSLRHGTFSRFRAVLNIDRLDEELRSSRESLRDGPMVVRAREIMRDLFNFARNKLEDFESTSTNERKASQRLADSPASLTERPIMRLMLDAFAGNLQARHLGPIDEALFESKEALQEHVEKRIREGHGLIADVGYAFLGTQWPMAMLDVVSGALSINLEHPFVAHFGDEFGDKRKNLPLQLFAISEILLEASLNDAGVSPDSISAVLDSRDELLRNLARSSGARNSLTVAQDLIGAASSKKGLEQALVNAFQQLGFEAIPVGGNDKPDGLASAFLPGDGSKANRYRVSLEAKSKESPGGKVKKKGVEVSTIARHRDEAQCDHAIVVGPAFETGKDDVGAVMREIAADRANNPGKTITLMRIDDVAHLVRLAPVKRINLARMRELFLSASSPDEAAAWVDAIDGEVMPSAPYQAILETVYQIQQDDMEHTVDYGSVRTALRMGPQKLNIADTDLRDHCRALSRMAPGLFFALEERVELNINPQKVLDTIHEYVDQLPAENQQ